MSQPKDLEPTGFGQLSWEPANIVQSLETLHDYATNQALEAIKWYYQKRFTNRRWGVGLRYAAIVSTAIAGIIPVLGSIWKPNGVPAIDPGWSAIAVALAALTLALEKFGGFTSAWVRYMVAAQQIGLALDEFLFTWATEKLQQTTPMDIVSAKSMVIKCRDFVLRVQGIVNEETQKWASEFQTALREIDEATKAAAEAAKARATAARFGAITVEVENGAEAREGWRLSVDGGTERLYSGKRAALTDIAPGILKIEVKGIVNGKEARDSKPVKVAAGETTLVNLKLE